MTLQPKEHHPHGHSDRDFDALFTTDKPVIFAYHDYPGRYIALRIVAKITTIFTWVATRKRERRRRLSI